MKKKIGFVATAIAAVVLAVPAFAAANAQLTEGGKALTGEPTFLTTSTNFTIKTSLGTLVCKEVEITGKVTKNTGGVVTAVGVGEGFGITCTVAGKPASVSDITVTHFHATGPNDAGNFINLHLTAVLNGTHCAYSAASIPFTYVSTGSSFRITNGDLSGTPAATCEPGTLNGDFSLETDVSPFTALVLD